MAPGADKFPVKGRIRGNLVMIVGEAVMLHQAHNFRLSEAPAQSAARRKPACTENSRTAQLLKKYQDLWENCDDCSLGRKLLARLEAERESGRMDEVALQKFKKWLRSEIANKH